MSLPHEKAISLKEFYTLRDKTDDLLEYSDGHVFMTPSPSTKHQRISGRLYVKLFHFLDGSGCEVFHAPFDAELHTDEGEHIVIPDLLVICDKSRLMENKYVGAPDVIFEILSPSNQAHDLVYKMNLYMQSGVKEYWIINPMLNIIQVYQLDNHDQYQQVDALKETGTIKSTILHGFEVKLEELFS